MLGDLLRSLFRTSSKLYGEETDELLPVISDRIDVVDVVDDEPFSANAIQLIFQFTRSSS